MQLDVVSFNTVLTACAGDRLTYSATFESYCGDADLLDVSSFHMLFHEKKVVGCFFLVLSVDLPEASLVSLVPWMVLRAMVAKKPLSMIATVMTQTSMNIMFRSFFHI